MDCYSNDGEFPPAHKELTERLYDCLSDVLSLNLASSADALIERGKLFEDMLRDLDQNNKGMVKYTYILEHKLLLIW